MITPNSPEYQTLTDEGKEAILEQIAHVTTACRKIGVLPSQANFDQIYSELCRDRYREDELMLFNEADYFYACFNVREQLEPDDEAQKKADKQAAAREELRARERAQRLEALDRRPGIDKGWRTKEQIEAADKESREQRQKALQQEAKERESRSKAEAAERATREDMEKFPARYCPDWTGDGAPASVLRNLEVPVLRYYTRRRQQYENEQAIAANEAAKAARKTK